MGRPTSSESANHASHSRSTPRRLYIASSLLLSRRRFICFRLVTSSRFLVRYCTGKLYKVNVTMEIIGENQPALTMEAPREYCLHTEDAADHKCYEGCASSTFKNKGVHTPGPCPGSYGVVEKDQVVEQCEDGVTNLRYCPGSRVNVTLKVKGEALLESALESTTAAVPTLDCSFADKSTLTMTVKHPGSHNIKVRTCRDRAEACTGAAHKWNSFKDCTYQIGPGQTVNLVFQKKVQYFVFYNTATAESDEFDLPKDGTWPSSHTISV